MAGTMRIAVIGGDGIGPEVIAEAIKVVRAAKADGSVETTSYDFGAQRYLRTGEILPASAISELASHDAILFGAVGDPRVPSGVLERGLILRIRFEFDQYINLRPVRLFPGVGSPLTAVAPIDALVVREGTEGAYIEAGGILRKGSAAEIAMQESINTAFGVGRVLRQAFGYAAARRRKKLTLVHKTNVLTHAGDLWRRTFEATAAEFPDVTTDYCHVDAALMYMVTQPDLFDVIVTDNLFGDVVTALGAAIAGGIGLAASASINPERTGPSTFEPVHGSAPDIAGKQKADPTAAILSVAMLCDHLGMSAEGARIEQAVAEDLLERQGEWAARNTAEVGDDIAERVAG
ncbi:MAG TPA: 3-isopropylmalate dehydrogenase [Streptosporangiaceae bacterium]|nr:3-isopropylmalate dehydrogenase [Streptosporangiaceae bacterium]